MPKVSLSFLPSTYRLNCSLLHFPIVDQIQIIPAHKYVLATGSSVFYAMFYGGLAEDKDEIRVPDVEPTAFLTLLRYMYCDEILLEPDNVLATLYVAKKYIVPHLARAAVNFLESSLTAKNACLLLSQSRLFEEPELMQRCWEVIDAQVRNVILIRSGETITTAATTGSSAFYPRVVATVNTQTVQEQRESREQDATIPRENQINEESDNSDLSEGGPSPIIPNVSTAVQLEA